MIEIKQIYYILFKQKYSKSLVISEKVSELINTLNKNKKLKGLELNILNVSSQLLDSFFQSLVSSEIVNSDNKLKINFKKELFSKNNSLKIFSIITSFFAEINSKQAVLFFNVSFDCTNFPKKNFKNLVEGLKTSKNLAFKKCSLNDAQILAITEVLKENNVLEELDLQGNKISDKGCGYIFNIITNNTAITSINLSNNKLTNYSAEIIVKCLQENKSLKILDLSKNDFNEESCKKFLELFKSERFEKIILPDTIEFSTVEKLVENILDFIAPEYVLKYKMRDYDIKIVKKLEPMSDDDMEGETTEEENILDEVSQYIGPLATDEENSKDAVMIDGFLIVGSDVQDLLLNYYYS